MPDPTPVKFGESESLNFEGTVFVPKNVIMLSRRYDRDDHVGPLFRVCLINEPNDD